MTDNPWDELEEPNKKKSTADDKSVVDFFTSLNRSDSNNRKKSKKNSKDTDNEDYGSSCFTFFKFSSNRDRQSVINSDNDCSGSNFDRLSSCFGFKKNLQLFFSLIFAVLFFWLISGFYTVKQEENAVVVRFGRYVYDVGAGLHYHLPFPIEAVIKEATKRVRVLKIGGDNYAGNRNDKFLGEGWALTGDENIVNLELNVQWKIDDLKKFVFKVRDKEQTIYDATQSAIREVISKRKLATILTSGRKDIEDETKKLLQEMLDSYDIGVNVLVVQMLKTDPPAQVLDSFRDVQTARVDKESEINKAYKYKNDILPKIKGEAGKLIEEANGYSVAVINRAKGEANRFNQIYDQYKNSPFVTRKRMYLETMEELFGKNKLTIIDENVKNVFLDLKTNSLNEMEKVASTEKSEDSYEN